MKALIKLSVITTFFLFTGQVFAQRYGNIPKVAASNPCQNFHKKACLRSPDDGFAYNGQSRSGLFGTGQTSTLKAVFYKGMDYHIAVCGENESPLNFQIKDAKTGEVLYDNASDNNTQEIQITNENTRHVQIVLVVPGEESKNMIKGSEGLCAGLLIEHRRSDKTGF